MAAQPYTLNEKGELLHAARKPWQDRHPRSLHLSKWTLRLLCRTPETSMCSLWSSMSTQWWTLASTVFHKFGAVTPTKCSAWWEVLNETSPYSTDGCPIVIFVYDYFLTLPEEIHHIWHKRTRHKRARLGTVLFLTARYCGILSLVFPVLVGRGSPKVGGCFLYWKKLSTDPVMACDTVCYSWLFDSFPLIFGSCTTLMRIASGNFAIAQTALLSQNELFVLCHIKLNFP